MNPARIFLPSLLVAVNGLWCARADWWVGPAVGDWHVPANWSGGVVPNNATGWAIAEVINGTAIVSTAVPTVSEAWAGNNGIPGNIIVTNGGTLTVANWLVSGRAGTGFTPLSHLIVHNGVINKTGDGFLVGDINNCRGDLTIAGDGVVNVTGGWFGVGNGEGGWGWVYLRDNGKLLLADGRDFNIGDWGTGRGWCYVQDNARIEVRRFWVGKNDTAGVMIQSGGVVQGFTPTANEWRIGEGAGAYGFYQLSGGTFNNPNNLHIGAWGKGLWYQSGGINIQSGWTAPGRYGGGWGIVYLTGGQYRHTGTGTRQFCAEQGRGEVTVTGSAVLDCNLGLVVAHAYGGSTGNGYLNVNGGVVRVPRFERWGDAPGGLAYISLNGGVIQAKANEPAFLENMTDLRVYAGGAVFDSAGFDITVNQPLLAPTGNGVISIPVLSGGSGYMGPPVVGISGGGGSGATAVAIMADDGTGAGTYRLESIVITCPGRDFSAPPTVTLHGGLPVTPATLGTPTLGPNSSGGLTKLGTGTLTLGGANTFTGPTLISGGALRANRPNVLSASANLSVALGATFDLNNNNQTVGSLSGAGNVALGSARLSCGGDDSSTVFSGSISGTGGLTKLGAGTLTLTGPNRYSGPTLVNGGKLAVTTASTGAGDYTLADGAGLAVQVLAANAQLRVANLTLGTSSGATLDFDLGAFGNPTAAPLDVAGALTVNGVITLNIAAANLAVGQFPLIKCSTLAGSGSFALGTLPARVVAELVINPANNSVDLRVLSFDSPKWAGLVSGGVWDIGTTTNWVGASSGTPTTYLDGDLVLFDDSAPGTTTVDLSTTVQPANVTINNSALSYTLTGTGKISGSAGLIKNGTGAFTLANSGGNDFAGNTVINAGTLAAGVANALSRNSLVQVAGGTLDIQGHDQSAGPVTLVSGAIVGSGALAAPSYEVRSGTISAKLTGSGRLTKATPGTVTLAGVNDYAGPTTINEGTLLAGAPNRLSPNSSLSINGGALDIQGHDQSAGPVTLVNGAILGTGTLTAPSVEVQAGTVDANLTGPGALAKSGGGTATINGNLSQAGETVVHGGTLVLNGNNTYGGDTVINGSGVAVVSADANLGAGQIVLNPGGTLRVAGTTSFASARNIVFGTAAWNGGTVDVAADTLALFTGAMTGAGGDTYFFKEGLGTMVYAGTTAFNDATHFFVNRGLLVLSNANLTVNRWSGVAGNVPGSDGTLAVVGNSVLTVLHDFNIGDVTPSRARFYLADNGKVIFNAFDIGKPANCVGAAYQVGGTLLGPSSWWGEMRIGGQWGTGDVGAYGFYLQAGGTFTNLINNWQVGAYAQGVYYQSGGVNVQGGWAVFGRFGGAPSSGYGVGYLTGGQFIHPVPAQHLIVGEQGRGELTIAGSAQVDLASSLWIGLNYGGFAGYGIVNLNGGTLATPGITMRDAGATSLLNFNGGTLRAKASDPNFIGKLTAAYVYPGGAVIDTAGFDIGIPQPLLAPDGEGVQSISLDNPGSDYIAPPIVTISGDGSGATAVAQIDYLAGTVTNIVVTCPGRGYTTALVTLSGGGGTGASATAILGPNASGGLTKLGAGTLTLSGANTFTGPVTVASGTLVHDGQFYDTVTVEPGGALDLGPALEDLAVGGMLTLRGTLYLDIDRDSLQGSDQIFGASAVSFGGRLVIRNLGSTPQLGDGFWLIDAGSYEGAFAELELPALPPGLAWDIPSLLQTGILAVREAVPQQVTGYRYDRNTGHMELHFSGNPGYSYLIQATTNVAPPIVWETLSTHVADLVTGLFQFIDTNAPAYPQRFYRSVQP